MLPCRLVRALLYLTLKPKFVFRPFSPANCPADAELTRYPPPVMKPVPICLDTVTTVLSSELSRM